MIYLVENEKSIRDLIVYTLKIAGFAVKSAENEQQFWKYTDSGLPELLLLDIMLPNNAAFEILKNVRKSEATGNLPVLLLADKKSRYDKAVGVETGANDYLLKPFEARELIARVKSVLGNNPSSQRTDYFIGNLRVNTQNHTVEVNQKEIRLAYKEFQLLNYFLEHTQYVLSREKIMEEIWKEDEDRSERIVDVYVRNLRQKLGEAGKMIETVWGIGYRINKR